MHACIPEVDDITQHDKDRHKINKEIKRLHALIGVMVIDHGRYQKDNDIVKKTGKD